MTMEARPRFKVKLTQADKTIEGIGLVLIFVIWFFVYVNYDNLPNTIPTHFNGAGLADGFGDKWMIFTLPVVATALYVALTILNEFPHVFNYPTEITAANAVEQYTNATRLIRYLKLIIVVIFGLIAFQTIRHAVGQTEGLGTWFLPLTIGLIFIPILYFGTKSLKIKQ
jgi:uncharacterized membrane protein